MKKLITLLVATLALALVAFTPDIASAGRGHGGGHGWHGGGHGGGHAWRGGYRGYRGYGYRGYRGYGYRAYRGYGGVGAAGGAQASPSLSAAMVAAAGLRPTAIIPAATAGAIGPEINSECRFPSRRATGARLRTTLP